MKKKLTEGNDRVKIAAVSEKKISQGRQVRGKSGQVCIWLNSLLRGMMKLKVVKTNLYLEKSPLKNIKRSKVKRGLKRYKVGKKN